MNLYNRIKADQLQARKDRNTIKVKSLTAVISDSTGTGINAGVPNDDAVITVIRKHLKNLKETASLLDVKDVRHQETLSEIDTLNDYLPKSFTDEEVRDLIVFEEKNIGKIMGLVKKAATEQGKLFDGAQVQRVIKSLD